ncbi:MAG: hypothetical protein AAF961_18420, partial [Planctomycetota bacterium]
GDAPSYSYTYAAMPNSKTAIASQAGMDGGNGGWAILYGADPITPQGNTINLAIDEDQSKDAERRHTTEQAAYFIIDPPVGSTPQLLDAVDMAISFFAFEREPAVAATEARVPRDLSPAYAAPTRDQPPARPLQRFVMEHVESALPAGQSSTSSSSRQDAFERLFDENWNRRLGNDFDQPFSTAS